MNKTHVFCALTLFAAISCTPNEAPAAAAPEPETPAVEPTSTPTASPAEGALAPNSDAWHAVSETDLSAEQLAVLTDGRRARQQLAATLMRTVSDASAEGPAAAIAACQDAAPRLAAEAATETLRIGRTSHRLRNPANQAPDWAAAHVAAEQPTPALFAHGDSRVAELVPISTAGGCVGCHGAAESLPEPVRMELAQRYPNDAATGFAEGDLRGWFWIEVGPVDGLVH